MYPMKEFIKAHVIEIENGAHFTPRKTMRRPLWFYYPTDRFPFYTIEVEEDIFPFYVKKDIFTTAEGYRIDNNQRVKGDLITRPMLYFAVYTTYEEGSYRQNYIPLYYLCQEIATRQGTFIVHRNSIKIYRTEDIHGRELRDGYLYSKQLTNFDLQQLQTGYQFEVCGT